MSDSPRPQILQSADPTRARAPPEGALPFKRKTTVPRARLVPESRFPILGHGLAHLSAKFESHSTQAFACL